MNNLYLAALCAAGGLGRAKLVELVGALGSARAVLEADAETLMGTGLLAEDVARAYARKRKARWPEHIEHFYNQHAVQLISYKDANYPLSLLHTADPPLVLYVKGKLPTEDYRFAVVGSRACTEYGRRAADYFASELAERGVPIISGGARGIDTAAHAACLRKGGKTVAVLGCGLDIVYPEENAGLFQRIVEQGGAVVSEFAPETPPIYYNFPARNRIIVGLSQGVLVAQAAKKSGAIITANIAADEGRDVYCVPGNIFDKTSIGCHELIRMGAKLVDNVEHILEDKLSWEMARKERIMQPSIFELAPLGSEEKEAKVEQPKVIVNASPLGQKLLACMQGGARSLEELTEYCTESLATVSMELLELQMQGLVAQDQAQKYYRR